VAYHLIVLIRAGLIGKALLLVIHIREIQHDGPGLENAQISILQRRNPSVRVDFDEPWLFLLVCPVRLISSVPTRLLHMTSQMLMNRQTCGGYTYMILIA
jgi:hypothetical protein